MNKKVDGKPSWTWLLHSLQVQTFYILHSLKPGQVGASLIPSALSQAARFLLKLLPDLLDTSVVC